MSEIIRNSFLLTGALVWFALVLVGAIYAGAFIANVYFWRWGNGAKSLRNDQPSDVPS